MTLTNDDLVVIFLTAVLWSCWYMAAEESWLPEDTMMLTATALLILCTWWTL